ncbi:MAG: Fumarate hydratase class II [Chlamydiae bacterium]|nr:Fumarate hydratase class II [Chlamydiota bacterium]
MDTRTETDSMGEIEVPTSAYYGAQTARSLIHFNIGHDKFPDLVIRSYALLKRAAAEVNCELGLLSEQKKQWIVEAAEEVREGRWKEHFPLSIWQTGSGTQTNMNVNEVIANRAIELAGGEKGSKTPIHPNDDVNMSQSSNDSFPTVMHMAAVEMFTHRFLPMVRKLQKTLLEKEKEFSGIVKIGRTHLMDAVPITLGQEFSGYVAQITQSLERLETVLPPLYELAIGGTAVGTGLNAPKGFAEKVVEKLAQFTHFPFVPASNKYFALATHDPLVAAHAMIKTLACSLIKIVTDLSFLGSGPRCGLGELIFPANEPGSSIMPGKVNPTQCEALTMIAVHVLGNDQAISIAGSRGNFELNVFKPMILHNFLDSMLLISDGLRSFTEYFLVGLKANQKQIDHYLQNSLMLVTALTPVIGYEKAAKAAHYAYEHDVSLKEACQALSLLPDKEFDSFVRPESMT